MENHADSLNDCEAPRSVSVKRMWERDINYAVGVEDTSLLFEHVGTFSHYFSM